MQSRVPASRSAACSLDRVPTALNSLFLPPRRLMLLALFVRSSAVSGERACFITSDQTIAFQKEGRSLERTDGRSDERTEGRNTGPVLVHFFLLLLFPRHLVSFSRLFAQSQGRPVCSSATYKPKKIVYGTSPPRSTLTHRRN